MGDAILRHDAVSHIHWLETDGKPDDDARAALKAAGWRWGGYRQQWYNNQRWACVPACLPYVDAGACDYAAERAERLEGRAERHVEASNAAYQRSNALVAMIPMGQPILVGHHSERADRNRRAKSWAAMDKSVAEAKTAERLTQAATASERRQRRAETPEAMQRRVERLGAELRAMQRRPWGGAQAEEWQRRVDWYTTEIAALEARIVDAGGIKADQLAAEGIVAEKGDLVKIDGFSGVVVRVNPKTYTIEVAGRTGWTLKLSRTRLQDVLVKKAEREAL